MRRLDLTGRRFGKLLVIDRALNNKTQTRWNCICDCGRYAIVGTNCLMRGHTKSCGCSKGEFVSLNRIKHGLKNTATYVVWKGMRERCNNPKASNYYRYGQRGIKVCEEWNDYVKFYEWAIANGYKEGLTLDRINNDGDYCPNNCRWVDKLTQGNNKCNNRVIEYQGQRYTLIQLSRLCGIERRTLGRRLSVGWSIEDAVTIPPKLGNRIKV